MRRIALVVFIVFTTLPAAAQAQHHRTEGLLCGPLLITPVVIAPMETGKTESVQFAAIGGAAPYTYSLASGTIPPGLTLDGSALSGTPAVPGTYIFNIRAKDARDCSTTTLPYTVVVAGTGCPTVPPQLRFPLNGSTNVGTSVRFKWDRVSGATAYALLVSANGGAETEAARTSDDEAEIEVPAGQIAWRVVASAGTCPTTSSQTFTFETGQSCPANPGTAALIEPADGAASLSSPVTLSWTAVPGAMAYRIIATVNGAVQLHPTLQTSLQLTFNAAATVFWQVEAIFGGGCPTTLSSRRTFIVAAPTACNNQPPVLTEPENGESDVASPVHFEWTAVPSAVGYRLFVGVNGAAPQFVAATTDTESTQVIATPGPVSWHVQAVFAGCDPVTSATRNFTVVPATSCPDGRATLLAPADEASVTNPVTFSWTAVAGATSYRVWGTSEAGTSILASTSATTAIAQLPAGRTKWRVEAQFAGDCRSTLSEEREVQVVAGSNCATNPRPVLSSPIGSAEAPVQVNSSRVELRWAAAAGASEYHVVVSMNGGADADVARTTGTSYEFEGPAGNYSWAVVAVFPGCNPLPSTRGYFRIAESGTRCPTGEPAIIAPADESTITSAEVTFVWTAAPGASAYRVYVRGEGAFVLIGTTTATTLTRPTIPGEFEWFVEAVFPQCPSTKSDRAEFTVVESANCATEPPRLLSPVDGATGVASPVELTWTAVAGAARYAVIAELASGSPTVIGETTETSLTAHLPAGQKIEWRVLAFRGGCEPLRSDSSEFTVAAPAGCAATRRPILLAPAEGARVTSPAHLAWTPVEGASGYRVWAIVNGQRPAVVASPANAEADVAFPIGSVEWAVDAVFPSCPPLRSGNRTFEVVAPPQACQLPPRPEISAPGQVLSDTPYAVRWSRLPGVNTYELQESNSRTDFSAANTILVDNASVRIFRYLTTSVLRKFYRVRGVAACNGERGPYSEIIPVIIVPPNAREQRTPGTAEIGLQQSVVQTIFVPGQGAPVSFTASVDKSFLHVSPSSGTIPPEGLRLTITADARALDIGANAATLQLTFGGAAGSRRAINASGPVNIPISVSLVTPVAPAGRNTPPLESLIIPAVGHAPGANNSLFQSDVRIANTSTQPLNYLLSFTPSGVDGTLTGSSTSIQVDAGATVALNDILASFFGTGPDGSSLGVLEIRPQSTSTASPGLASPASSATIASSRTYNVTEIGTLGQYIPAIPFSQFVGKPADGTRAVLSLQQIAQSAAYRTNLGLVEGSGEPATLTIRVFDAAGNLLGEIPESLRAGEHKQINALLQTMGIAVDDGRIEIEPTSATGRITAYASRVDNLTNDPLLVQPVLTSAISATRYVIPGIAYADGLAKWRSDIRIYNSATTDTAATITFYPEGNPAAATSKEVTLPAGDVLALDNVLQSFFGVTTANATGSLLVSTTAPSSLVATARTYAESDSGTFGLFAPGVTPDEAVGAADGSLHLLQLEQSPEYRTNIGLVETTGNAATVEISLIQPGTLATGKLEVPLEANEFVQFPLSAFGGGTAVYNARVAVKVISGTGRVSAYGAVVDNRTADATYVPAQ
jgi:hypothetical protein